MKKKRMIILLIVILLIAVVSISTYAIYKSSSTGNVTIETANWKIKLNGQDITSNNTFTYNLKDADWTHDTNIDSDEQNVVVIAPGSYGTFNLTIDATEAEVDVKYKITARVLQNDTEVNLSSVNSNLSIGYYNNNTLVNGTIITGEMDAMTSHSLELRVTWNEVDSAASNAQDININDQNYVIEVTVVTKQSINTPTAAQTVSGVEGLVNTADALRYVGPNPSNYVEFNGETWRILGVYGNQLKLIRNSAIGEFSYSSNSIIYANSSVRTYLNGTYYNSLTEEAKAMMDNEGVWYVGDSSYNKNASEAYEDSKGETLIEKIGLLATYEYQYGSNDSSCYTISGNRYGDNYCGTGAKDWLVARNDDEWTLTAYFYDSSKTRGITLDLSPAGYVAGCCSNYSMLEIRPVLYLKSSVLISGGTGTISDKYKLDIL